MHPDGLFGSRPACQKFSCWLRSQGGASEKIKTVDRSRRQTFNRHTKRPLLDFAMGFPSLVMKGSPFYCADHSLSCKLQPLTKGHFVKEGYNNQALANFSLFSCSCAQRENLFPLILHTSSREGRKDGLDPLSVQISLFCVLAERSTDHHLTLNLPHFDARLCLCRKLEQFP